MYNFTNRMAMATNMLPNEDTAGRPGRLERRSPRSTPSPRIRSAWSTTRSPGHRRRWIWRRGISTPRSSTCCGSSGSTRITPQREASYLYDAAGRAYLDFHTGEGFASLGHNHPDVRDVLKAALDADLVDGVQIHYSPLAGMLAEALSQRLPQGSTPCSSPAPAPRRWTRR